MSAFDDTVYSVVGTTVDTAVEMAVDATVKNTVATVDISVRTAIETTVDTPVDGKRSTYKLRPFATSFLHLADSACVPYMLVSILFGCLILSREGFAGPFGSYVGGRLDAPIVGHRARIASTGCALS